jgi:nickel transport protein
VSLRPFARVATAALILGAASAALAHQLNVFASTDCEVVLIEAKFSSGRVPVMGEVRILDGDNTLLLTRELGEDGTLRVPLAELDATSGLLIEVDTGDHNDYWILTPEDIARKCQS